ncbi:efflux RND transporter periplasmic adaptor subunit [Pareuzebyella sediminis]|uniref:efflux RND transporter periplasmic adaptor subunit n=1 Tax=Pareuzebyella sediminis TaxID=2607998 RepID=UPI0011EC990D|nr:efflux RND transporter periplasmic adaptor subunit [Pareuzebyella sediminis]
MNRTIGYIVLAVLIGFMGGYFIFGTPSKKTNMEAHSQEGKRQSQMWTCSMHPQIMQSEPGDCPICGMDLIPAGYESDEVTKGQFKMSENAMILANITTTKIGSNSSRDQTLSLSGAIVANKEAVAVQASYFEGRIEKLFLNYEGEEVRKGQLLATLYAPALVSAQQELLTAANLKKTQPSLYKAVRNKLKLWKLTDAQIDKIESSGKVREHFPVYANVSGTVSEVMVAAGDYVEKGAPLLKIADLGTVWAVFDAYENQVSLLKEGQHITVKVKSFPNKRYEATISFVDPVLNASTRTVRVRAVLKNTDGQLKPGMFVTGMLHESSGIRDSALVVPESAVLWTGERSLVYVKPDSLTPAFELREVHLGNTVDEGYTVLSGLEKGEAVVTNGTFTVDAAAQLKGKNSMMNHNHKEGHSGTSHEVQMMPQK